METFLLWSITPGETGSELSFCASWVQAQRIKDGTPEMIGEMLGALGLAGAEIRRWELSHFATDYLMDDRADPFWPSIWMHTVEIRVALERPAATQFANTDLVRTWAVDSTWQGDCSPPTPLRCVIVADFLSRAAAVQAAQRILAPSAEPAVPLGSSLVDALRELRLVEKTLLDANGAIPVRSVSYRGSSGTQLAISLGVFSPDFYAQGAPLGKCVARVCRAFDGAPTWQESTEPGRFL